MNNVRQPAIGFMVFMMFVGLVGIIYGGLESEYGIVTSEEMMNGTQNMAEALEALDLTDNIVELANNVVGIVTPSNPFDVLGSLAASGIGVLQLLFDITTYPVSIINVVTVFYGAYIPTPILSFIKVIFIVAIAFILLSVILKRDV